MNRYFSDFLPPALVRDMRRSLHSRAYIMTLLVALLAAAWMQYSAGTADAGWLSSGAGVPLALLGTLLMWFVIPNRAGASVSADAKVKGTNFMMLTPLSSRRIVWGTWFSAVFQLMVVAGLGALVLWWRHATLPEPGVLPITSLAQGLQETVMPTLPDRAEELSREWILYGLIVGVGVVMCAVFMFLAQLSRIFRLLVGAVVLVNIWGVFTEYFITMDWFTRPDYDPMGDFLKSFTGYSLWVRLGDVLVLVWTLLELARRAYASPAENCSRSVRLLALLPLVSVPVLWCLLPGEAELVSSQCTFALYFAVFACMSDALLPTYSLPAHAKRSWPVLPGFMQVPGVGASALCVVVVLALCSGGKLWLLIAQNGLTDCGYFSSTVEVLRKHGYEWLPVWTEVLRWLTLSYTLLAALLLTDLLCKRTNVNRPVVYGVVMMALVLLGSALVAYFAVSGGYDASAPAINAEVCASAALPGACLVTDGGMLAGDVPADSSVYALMWQRCCVSCAISGVGMLLTLLLLVWRGRKR